MSEEHIKRLIEKLPSIKDEELKELIKMLLGERQELTDYAMIDHLTGLYNRKKLDEITNYGAVVMCDIDNFKGINDTFGHDFGDKVLKLVAKKLKSNTRHDDIICRYGGDEFLVVFQHCPLNIVVERMERIQKDLESSTSDLNIDVTLSIGISESKNEMPLASAITQADSALYFSKENGKRQISIYEEVKDKIKSKK